MRRKSGLSVPGAVLASTHPNLVLAASNAKTVMLEQSLEQTKQSNQSIIAELESSKEHLVVELAASNAKNVLLEARLASTTDEDRTKADDNWGVPLRNIKLIGTDREARKKKQKLTTHHVNMIKCQPYESTLDRVKSDTT